MQHALTQPRGFRLPLVLTYAGAIWLAGFAWGSIVFMIPALKAIAPIPYVSSNPAISFPSLLLWLPLTYWLARRVLRASDAPAVDGLTVGMLFAAVNALLDLLVLVVLLDAGTAYFFSLTVWLGYALLLVIP